MAAKGKKAWLITWEDFGFKHWGLDKPRVVAVLSSRLSPQRIEQIVIALWCAQADLTLSEHLGLGLDRDRHKRMFTKEDIDHFYFGFKPFLYARTVRGLRCDRQDSVHTLHWKETPICKIDRDSHRPVIVRNEFNDSWSQHENEIVGS